MHFQVLLQVESGHAWQVRVDHEAHRRRRRRGEMRLPAGDIDLIGDMTGGGGYAELRPHTIDVDIAGVRRRCVTLPTLIARPVARATLTRSLSPLRAA